MHDSANGDKCKSNSDSKCCFLIIFVCMCGSIIYLRCVYSELCGGCTVDERVPGNEKLGVFVAVVGLFWQIQLFEVPIGQRVGQNCLH